MGKAGASVPFPLPHTPLLFSACWFVQNLNLSQCLDNRDTTTKRHAGRRKEGQTKQTQKLFSRLKCSKNTRPNQEPYVWLMLSICNATKMCCDILNITYSFNHPWCSCGQNLSCSEPTAWFSSYLVMSCLTWNRLKNNGGLTYPAFISWPAQGLGGHYWSPPSTQPRKCSCWSWPYICQAYVLGLQAREREMPREGTIGPVVTCNAGSTGAGGLFTLLIIMSIDMSFFSFPL